MKYIVLLIILFIVTVSFLSARYVVFNKKKSIEQAEKEYGYKFNLLSYKTTPFSIVNNRGKNLYGDRYYVENSKGIIIICHGFSCNRVFSHKYAQMFLALGYDVLVYDHTHSGQSEGTRCGMGYYESEDLECIVQYIIKNENYKVIGTHGESMGAATVLKHMGKYNSPDFCIADCPYESLRKQIKSRINKLLKLPGYILLPVTDMFFKLLGNYSFKDVDIAESTRNIKKPFMLVHGSTDRYISVEDSLNLYDTNENCKKIYICNGADHAMSYEKNPFRYKKEVMEFLDSLKLD